MSMPPLRPYQERVVRQMLDDPNRYLALDLGLGKTRCCLEYLARTGHPALIVAPYHVAAHTWPHEIAKWTPGLSYAVLHGPRKDDLIKTNPQLMIINYDGLKWLAKHGIPPVKGRDLILDESTNVKNRSAVRSKILKAMRPHIQRCYCLSALPAPHGLGELWSQFRILDGGATLGEYWTPFFRSYFEVGYHQYDIRLRPGAADEIMARVAPRMTRLAAEDYLSLPETVHNDVRLTLPDKLRGLYHRLRRDLVLELHREGGDVTIAAANRAVVSSKLWQLLQGAIYDADHKVQWLHRHKLDALGEVHESLHGAPHLVAAQYRFEFEALRQRYGADLPVINGDTKPKDKIAYLDAWNRGELPMLVVHPASVSHGLNLQDGGHYMTWLALTRSLESYIQLNGRLRRSGQQHPVVYTRILFADTVDDRIAQRLANRKSISDALLDLLKEDDG